MDHTLIAAVMISAAILLSGWNGPGPRGGGYQPRSHGRPLGSPPTGGSGGRRPTDPPLYSELR